MERILLNDLFSHANFNGSHHHCYLLPFRFFSNRFPAKMNSFCLFLALCVAGTYFVAIPVFNFLQTLFFPASCIIILIHLPQHSTTVAQGFQLSATKFSVARLNNGMALAGTPAGVNMKPQL